jgi:hypothetical protein
VEKLIREIEALRQKPQLTNSEVVGLMLSSTIRFREVLDDRMIGIQALAVAVAMQPQVDVLKLHDDYLSILKAHFESMRHVPVELKDIAAVIKLAATERH